jgi:hypothetical protein
MTRVISVYAWEVQAGDYLVVKDGSIRKSFHVCETGSRGNKIELVYNGVRHEFVRISLHVNDVVKIRE